MNNKIIQKFKCRVNSIKSTSVNILKKESGINHQILKLEKFVFQVNCKIYLCRTRYRRENALGFKITAFNLWHLLRKMHTESILPLSFKGRYLNWPVLREPGQHCPYCSS